MEYINLYDEKGNPLKEKGIRGQKNPGLKGVVIIYIENTKGEFLIQKTSSKRGSIYATTGGHVSYGSDFFKTIIKEVQEELGIDISKDHIKEMTSYITEDYYLKTYYLKKDIDIKDITIQEEEVDYVKWMNTEEIDELIKKNQFRIGNIEGYQYIKNKKVEV